MKRRDLILMSGALALAPAARAQTPKFSDDVIRIGILNDRSGPYADLSGPGSEVSARMAVEDFGGKVRGVPIDVIAADHQNKPDLGVAIAREWFDTRGVDAIFDVTNSAVSLAINSLLKDRNDVVIHNSMASDISGAYCDPRSAQWQYTAWAGATNLVNQSMIDGGINTFFIIAVDYALGASLAEPFRAAVERLGGRIVGEVKHPLNSGDFSSYILQAQSSGAKAVMLANAGSDLVNTVKQAREFGLTPGVQLLAGALTSDVIGAVGLETMQGIEYISRFEIYRDQTSIDWSKRFSARFGGKLPTEEQACTYSAVHAYLKAAEAAGTDSANAVMAQMRTMTFNDAFAVNGHLRPDGIMAHDLYLVRIKGPSESKRPGDYSTILATIAGDVANIPLADSTCPLVRG